MSTPGRAGIEGQPAPELKIETWVDAEGGEIASLQLADLAGRFKVLYCFQSWCPGCHQAGFPTLAKLVEHFRDGDDGDSKVSFAVVQTVFEGFETNTFEAMLETQKKYGLGIPFGHDPGAGASGDGSTLMRDYRCGGTPWFIVISPEDRVVFNDFRVNSEGLIDVIEALPGL